MLKGCFVRGQDRLTWNYSTRGNEQLSQRYDQRVIDYDADLEEGLSYLMPQRTIEAFSCYVSWKGKILDAGVDSGLAGKRLAKKGYADLVAMDLSLGRLEEAREKRAYQEIHQMIRGEPWDFAIDSFKGVISVGVFTEEHAPPSSLDELIRITKHGGYIVSTLNA